VTATKVPFDKYGNRDEKSLPLTELVGPPSKDWAVRLLQLRAVLHGDLIVVVVGPHIDERYELPSFARGPNK
jgi:hypothetical protein